jgi:uncharacterized protein (DUF58 family)
MTVFPSRRFLILASLGLLPAALGAAAPVFFLVALLYFAACGALLAAEYFFGARGEQFEALRRVRPRLSLSEPETVELTVRNFSRWPAQVAVLDTTPSSLEASSLPLAAGIPPQSEVALAYEVTPTLRGKFRFGDLFLRVEHFPGMLTRQVRVPAAEEVRVLPDMREVARYEIMVRRSRLQEMGIHRSRYSGRGTEFERIRDYTPDDEYRQIDWKATARRRKPMSRVYEVERSQNVFLCIDAGRMMAGRVGRLSKLDYAINAALMLAHVALRSGDRVGLIVVSDEVDAYLPFGKGQAHFQTCTEMLYSIEPRLCHVDYRGAIEQVAVRCKRRSLVVFFTDLIDEETSAELVTYLRLLRPVHLPMCVTLRDASIVSRAATPPSTLPEMYERTVALELLGERRRVLDGLQKLGAVVLDCAPEELSVAVVNRYLELKARQLL